MRLECRGHGVDDSDDALGDGVQVVVIGRTHLEVDAFLSSDLFELLGLELPFVIAVESTEGWASQRFAVAVDGSADAGVEVGDDA